jgi:hypothetical protein
MCCLFTPSFRLYRETRFSNFACPYKIYHKEYRHYHHYSSDNYDSLSFLLSGVGDCDGEYLQKGGLDIWDWNKNNLFAISVLLVYAIFSIIPRDPVLQFCLSLQNMRYLQCSNLFACFPYIFWNIRANWHLVITS